MPQYTPPVNGVVNFAIQTYTPPTNGVANFSLEDQLPPAPAQKFNKITFGPQYKPMVVSNVGKPIVFG